ncbi:PREDICTED: UPF0598 protein C8orf82 homolog [Calidris pugnax]|uniref:UPF0598 protein C8orf82 homolog n=1 Tax=Calidris pugnax TaxID=198806 RepID=UPI00071CC0AA|nr:PREDICTED: UPF0598 protein C8orf82 homolog [Calidris pugnax]
MGAYRGVYGGFFFCFLRLFPSFPQLFLDDTKVKNFITCFKDVAFLSFFFKRLEPNRSGRYEEEFPFLSPCGGERNFLRCEDRPIVFTHLLTPPNPPQTTPPNSGSHGGHPPKWLLSYCGGGHRLVVPFQPQSLVMLPENGRLYHPAPAKTGGVGLVRSALALEWSPNFEFGGGPTQPPTHFLWEGQRYRLTEELLPLLRGGEEVDVPLAPRQG